MGEPEPMRDPPTDNAWLGLDGGYVHRPDRDTRHRCQLPAEWIKGAVWRCSKGCLWIVDDACECRGHIERHGGRGSHLMLLAWRPATFWERRRHGGKRAREDMANENRDERYVKPFVPPPGPGGVSGDG